MKNLKKVCALVLSLAMIVSTFTVSFAAEDTKTDAEICEALGMLKGEGDGVTDEYLAKSTTRFQAALMVLRLQNLEEEALAFEGTETFADAEDLQWVVGRSVLAYLKANPELGWLGDGENFDPNGAITAQAYYKVMLEAIGYKQGTDFEWADVLEFAAEKGLEAAADVENFTNNEIAVVTVETLKAETKEGKKLVDVLVEAGAIDEEKAVEVGLVEAAPTEVAVKSAVALNSKVIKVTLDEAAEEVSVSQFTIVDKDASQIEIADVELAPWDADNKTVLITLAEDSKSGNLYTVTSGEVSVNFGGKAKDETKPAIDAVTSSDYNEVTITFKEAVRIDGLSVNIAKKYADKAELASMDITYADEKTVLVKTDDQAASTLYGLVVEGAVDLAGNTMDKDDDKSFVGTKKNDAKQKISSASALDYNKVYVEFSTNVDFNTLSDATFKLEKAYGTATELQVLEVREATDVEAGEFNTSLSSTADKKKAAKKGVILMVEDMKASTLYKLTVEGVGTLYEQPMSTTTADKTTTFVGQAKPTGKFKVAGDVKTVSATSIDVTFERKVEKDLAEDIANYDIKKAYGDNAELAVLEAEVQSNGKTVRLTVGEMKNSTLYKMVITNLKDIYGNDQDKMEPTFVGQGKQAKISKIDSITRQGTTDTVIRVNFDKNVGANATDVSLYFINNGVGYPESVATVTNNPDCVDLTIPKTTDGKTYELVVKGLNNADGIAMDADGVKGTFVGRGLAATLPEITGAVTLSNSKIEIYFDRDVTDSSIKGRFWNSGSIDDTILYVNANYANSPKIPIISAYQNPQNKNSLILVGAKGAFSPVTSGSNTYDKLTLTGVKRNIKGNSSTTNRTLTVATNGTESFGPKMIGIVAVDKKHLEVHFDQPVQLASSTIAGLSIYDDVKGGVPVTATQTGAYVDPSNKTKVDIYFLTNIVEGASSTDKDNQFVFVLDSLNDNNAVKGLDGKDAKGDPNGNSFYTYQTIAFAGSSVDQAAGIDSGIFGVFTDKNTLEIMFPQAMKTDRLVKTNFSIQRYNGSTPTSATQPVHVTYSSTNNKATLYFNSPITLAANDTLMKLEINKNVETAGGIPVCADKSVTPTTSFANYFTRVAAHDTATAKPALASVTVDDTRRVLNVTFDKEVSFATASTFVAGNNANDLRGTSDITFNPTETAKVLTAFKLVAVRGDGQNIDEVLGTDTNISVSSVKKTSEKTYVITLDNALLGGSEVKLSLNTAANKVYTWTGEPNETDLSKVSSVTTGVTTSPLFDESAVKVTTVTSPAMNYNASKVDSKIPVTVKFDGIVSVSGTPKLVTNLGDATYASGSGTNTLVFEYKIQAGDNATLVTEAAGITLTATNTIKGVNNVEVKADSTSKIVEGTAGITLTGVVVDTVAPIAFGFTGSELVSTTANKGFTLTDNSGSEDTLAVDLNIIQAGDTCKITIAGVDYTLTNDNSTTLGTYTGDTAAVVTITDAAGNSTSEDVTLKCTN